MKKGFTLIELLAVIVVLAILALIVTPIVINIVGNARKGANLRSMESYAKILESSYVEAKMQDPSLTKDAFLSNISSYATGYSGNRVICGSADIDESNNLSLYNCTIDGEGDFCYVNGNATDKCDSTLSSNLNINVGDIIYFDVKEGKRCSENEYNGANSSVGYNGIDNKTSEQTSCLKFYAFALNDKKVDLILDHNTTESVTYSSYATYATEFGPVPSSAWDPQLAGSSIYSSFINKLKLDTQNWTGVLYNDEYSSDMFNYVGVKARFLTQNDINLIKNNFTNYNEILDGNNYPEVPMYSDHPKVSVYDVRPTYSFTYNFTAGIRPVISVEY